MVKKVSIIMSIIAACLFTANAATVSGTVTDTATPGVPIAGAKVTLTSGFGGTAVTLTDTTDAQGLYSFTNFTATAYPATVRIAVTKSGYNAANSGNVTVDSATAVITKNIPMTPLSAGVAVSGDVTDSLSTTPIVGAKVYLRQGNLNIDSAETIAGGAFSFDSVQAGNYTLRAILTGYVTKNLATFAVAATPVTGKNIQLVAIVYATVSGVVTDSLSTTPIVGAKVYLREGNQNIDSAVTIAGGAYSFDSVQSGTYSLRASLAGYTTKTVANIAVTGTSVAANIPLVAIVYTTVSGTVTDSVSTTPIVGAKVYLRQGNLNIDSAVTITGGAYTIDSVQTGTYTLRVSLTGYQSKTSASFTVTATPVPENIQLVAIVTTTISGTVTDTVSTAVIPGAKVYLRQGGTTIVDSVTTAANGTYSMPISTGTYSLVVSATGYSQKTVQNIVITTTAVQKDVQLVPIVASILRGKITSDSLTGPALAGATVIVSRNGAAVDTATTDANGQYEISNLQSTLSYSVSASLTGYTLRTVTNTQAAGFDTVNIALPKINYGNLFVVVLKTTDSTTAISGASISATRTGAGGTALTGTSGANGYTAFETILTGTYSISVTASGYAAGTGSRVVAADAKDTVKIYLAASATKTLRGTVTDSSNGTTPLANVRVTLTLTGTGASLTIIDSTDASGNYSIEGIPATRTTGSITATKTGYTTRTINAVTLGTADTTIRSFKMLAMTSVLSSMNVLADAKPVISVAGACLQLRNINESGVVSLISANGKLVFHSTIAAHTTAVVLPKSKVAAGTYLVNITQRNVIINKQIMVR